MRQRNQEGVMSEIMDTNERDQQCIVVLNPGHSPIYGGGIVEVIFSKNVILPPEKEEFFMVFWGLTARHLALAKKKTHHTLEAVIPGHDRFETVKLDICVLVPQSSSLQPLAEAQFNFMPDSTFYLAQFLASSVWDLDCLENPGKIKSEKFDLQTEDKSTLDYRLTAAFEHLEFPSSWNLVVDPGKYEQSLPPRETLLHFAARLGLTKFAEHLLDRPGSDIAVQLQNKNGELPGDIAKQEGLHVLAKRMLQLASHQDISNQRIDNVEGKNSKVKRYASLGTASITSKLHEVDRTLEDDIQMLRDIMNFMEEEDEDVRSCEKETTEEETSPLPTSLDTVEEALSHSCSEDEDDEDVEDGDAEEDGNESEEADEMPEAANLDEDLSRIREVTKKVQKFKELNKPWMSSAEERRQNLSRFSSSCPVLVEDGKPSSGWPKLHIPTLPSAIQQSSDEEDEGEGADSSRSVQIQIQVNDTILDNRDNSPDLTVPRLEDVMVSNAGSEDSDDHSGTNRRHSWAEDGKESKVTVSSQLGQELRCQSMLNLNSGTGVAVSSKDSVSLKESSSLKAKKMLHGYTEKTSVTFQDASSDQNDEPDVTTILPPDNSNETFTDVVRRRRKTSKDIRKQKSASMFEPRSTGDIADILEDNNLPNSTESLTEKEKTRQSRLSLTEFLSDPMNFISEDSSKDHAQTGNRMFRKLSFLKPGGSRREKRGKQNREKAREKEKEKEREREREKEKEIEQNGDCDRSRMHHFVSTSFSNSTTCDHCGKSLMNKGALQCQSCSANVHVGSCKENIGPCSKLTRHPKTVPKASGNAFIDKLKLQTNNLGHSQSLREKTRPHSETSQTLQPFPQNAFQGSTPELRSPPAGNRTIEENDEADANGESSPKGSNFNNSMSFSTESLDEVSGDPLQYEEDEDLVTRGPEPESWSVTVEKKTIKKMSSKEIKRQDVIFEFIKTEKHHLRTLKIMQKIFSFGMQNELHMDQTILSKVFPMLDQLVDIASNFYEALKERQKEAEVVGMIGDVLCQQFDGDNGEKMRTAFGFLCSRQKEAVSVYKDLHKTDRKFQSFIKKCSTNALCRRWSIPECILAVSHRLTKYPLLLEAIMKPTKSTKADKIDTPCLEKALSLVKHICNDVDFQVQEHERWQKLLDTYHKLEARSTAPLKNGKKFKKSDLLNRNRKWIEEGEFWWKSARGKLTEVHVVLLTDLLLFFQENNQKYTFASQDNKAPVIHLHKLMVRDVATDDKSIYIISPKDGPEMYEIMCESSEMRKEWRKKIELAVANCPEEVIDVEQLVNEEKKMEAERTAKIKKILVQMKENDDQLETLVEEKLKMLRELQGLANSAEDVSSVGEVDDHITEAGEIIMAAIKEANVLGSSVYDNSSNILSRSASSAGEKESQSYHNLVLPKRAETFSGFDSTIEGNGLKKKSTSSLISEDSGTKSSSYPNLANDDFLCPSTTSPAGSDETFMSAQEEENDLLGPISPASSTESPRRSPSPSKQILRSSHLSLEGGKRRGSNENRGRSYTLTEGIAFNKVQFELPTGDASARPDLQGYEETDQTSSGSGLHPDQLLCVSKLLEHLHLLLSITTKKDTAYESLLTELTEAKSKMASKSHSISPKQLRKSLVSLKSPPPVADGKNFASTARSSSLKDDNRNDKNRTERLNNQRSVHEGVMQDSLRKIAFGDMMPSNQTIPQTNPSQTQKDTNIHATASGHQQLPLSLPPSHSIQSRSRVTSADPSNRTIISEKDDHSRGLSNRQHSRKQTPAHLMSTTNELSIHRQYGKQQIPLQLSQGKQPSGKQSPVQQMLPKRLSTDSGKNPVQQMLPKRLSTESGKSSKKSAKSNTSSEHDVIYF